jgi:hypothetical protein
VNRRQRLSGRRLQLSAGLVLEVRRSCRDELKLVYDTPPLPRAAWVRLATLGKASVLEASRINPAMHDLYRVLCAGMRFEGAVDGTLLVAFFKGPGRLGARHRLEALLRELCATAGASAAQRTA